MEITKTNLEKIIEITANELVGEISNGKIISQDDLRLKLKVFISLAIKQTASQIRTELKNQREKLLTQLSLGRRHPELIKIELSAINARISETTQTWAQAKDFSDKITYAKAIHAVIQERFGETELLQITKKAEEIQNKTRCKQS